MKKIKNCLCSILALCMITTEFVSLPKVKAFADLNDEALQAVSQTTVSTSVEDAVVENTLVDDAEELFEESFAAEEEQKLMPIIDSEYCQEGEKIQIEFDSSTIEGYYYETEGINLTEKNADLMQFEIVAEEGFGRVDVYADYGNEEAVKSSIYTYTENGLTYISDVSEDQAWYNYMEAQYNEGLLTKEEWESAYSELSRTFIVKEENSAVGLAATPMSVSSSEETTFTGVFRWQLADRTKLPLRRVKVELRDVEKQLFENSRCIATTYTNNNGEFTFTFNTSEEWYALESDGLDVFIRIVLESETFAVAQDWVFSFNYFDTEVEENLQSGIKKWYNYYVPYNEDNNVNKSTYVHQGMVLGQSFAQSQGMNTNKFMKVQYPGAGSFCFNLGTCYAMIEATDFNNFDTLVHEYGHFVENAMGTYGATLWEMMINSPKHFVDTCHFEDKQEKEYAMELTWSEAWATAFSMIAQTIYKEDDYIGVPDIGDLKFLGNDLESYSVGPESGESNEESVTAFLWDLYDNDVAVEAFDNIHLTISQWWNYTTRSGMYKLSDFVSYMELNHSDYRNDIGKIMSEYCIAPANFTLVENTTVSLYSAPQLKWRINGSDGYPNNEFQIVCYDAYGNLLGAVETITSTSTNRNDIIEYSVPYSAWRQIVKDYGGEFTINIVVRGFRDGTPKSGPYNSPYISITLTEENRSLTVLEFSRYVERKIRLDKEQYCDFTVNFATAGWKIIQTFGTKDTVIEIYSESGTLLKGKSDTDDNGYKLNAFIRYYTSANTTYKIRVKFCFSYIYGETKLAITPAAIFKNHESESLSAYEDIYAIKNYTGYTLYSYAVQNRTQVITYTPPSAGTYTISLESVFDNYLYVIDPRSADVLVSKVDMDDDSGDGLNASLTKELDANVPYFIIQCAYDITQAFTDLDEGDNLTIRINKN